MSTVITQTEDEPAEANTGEAALAAHICPNCGHHIDHPLPNYCGHCGQETRLKPPTVVEFLQQFGGSIIATDEKQVYRTGTATEYILFPNPDVRIGQRAGLMVIEDRQG